MFLIVIVRRWPRSMASAMASRSASRRASGFIRDTLEAKVSRAFVVSFGASSTRSVAMRPQRQRRQRHVEAEQRTGDVPEPHQA